LVEADLCQEYQVGRSVVRAAFNELVNEGIVELQWHRGARVRKVSPEEAIEIVEVRLAVEGLIAAKAAERAGPGDIAELRQNAEAMRRAVAQLDAVGYSQLNTECHALIQRIADHGTASAILDRLRGQGVRHQLHASLRPGRAAASLRQHVKIIEAIAAGDPEAAQAEMQEHLDDVLQYLLRMRDADTASRSPASLAP
jgi:DNA-binding GntR family transcriptional regulator